MNITPPLRTIKVPEVLAKLKNIYLISSIAFKLFPKTMRYSLGSRISNIFLTLLELIFIASYQSKIEKIVTLTEAIKKLDLLKFFFQIAWETKCISTVTYTQISEPLAEIGKMLFGWKRGLETQTPDTKSRVNI